MSVEPVRRPPVTAEVLRESIAYLRACKSAVEVRGAQKGIRHRLIVLAAQLRDGAAIDPGLEDALGELAMAIEEGRCPPSARREILRICGECFDLVQASTPRT